MGLKPEQFIGGKLASFAGGGRPEPLDPRSGSDRDIPYDRDVSESVFTERAYDVAAIMRAGLGPMGARSLGVTGNMLIYPSSTSAVEDAGRMLKAGMYGRAGRYPGLPEVISHGLVDEDVELLRSELRDVRATVASLASQVARLVAPPASERSDSEPEAEVARAAAVASDALGRSLADFDPATAGRGEAEALDAVADLEAAPPWLAYVALPGLAAASPSVRAAAARAARLLGELASEPLDAAMATEGNRVVRRAIDDALRSIRS